MKSNKVQLIIPSQAEIIKQAAYEDGMHYRKLALETGNRNDAKLAIYNFRVWIQASIIDLIDKKQIAQPNDNTLNLTYAQPSGVCQDGKN